MLLCLHDLTSYLYWRCAACLFAQRNHADFPPPQRSFARITVIKWEGSCELISFLNLSLLWRYFKQQVTIFRHVPRVMLGLVHSSSLIGGRRRLQIGSLLTLGLQFHLLKQGVNTSECLRDLEISFSFTHDARSALNHF